MSSSRFNNAMTALVGAFLKGTLAKGNCQACAVGNMVAHSMGDKLDMSGDYPLWERRKHASWDEVFLTPCSNLRQRISPEFYQGTAKEEIDATGYTWQELARVESAFEGATSIFHSFYQNRTPEEIDADQLNGLHAVVDVLCEIEGITDTAPYKAQFDKSLALPVLD